MKTDPFFTVLPPNIIHVPLPKRFTFPFHYTPHPIAIAACEMLMDALENGLTHTHNFGIESNATGLEIGKMFGVLIVKNNRNELGYLKAFSGKLGNSNHHEGFVPPIFDMLDTHGFFLKGEDEINKINAVIDSLEQDLHYLSYKTELEEIKQHGAIEIERFKQFIKIEKQKREAIRKTISNEINNNDSSQVFDQLIRASCAQKNQLKTLQLSIKKAIETLEQKIAEWELNIEQLKQKRKEKSFSLQQKLFDQYNFLNQYQERKNVRSIFEQTAFQNPPSGAGECATPKLLQYAFLKGYQPIAMGEFWWGKSPISEIRKHKNYYPACRGKCLPILNHMLLGIEMDDNPMLQNNPNSATKLDILYEDEQVVVVNKPHEFLSVPGLTKQISILDLLQAKYPNATGPLLVHRLDMSTSGILIAAKTKESYQNIQSQFIKKTISKRYVAVLNGLLDKDYGQIELPLRVDFENRPFQIVCYEHGKKAVTKWKVISRNANTTKVYFYPITGRTHQLRVHAAHVLGLNTPIIGDDLYGTKAGRLYLHAEQLTFKHPVSREQITVHCEAPF